jgi:dihydrolipoamide dehydrogenase
VSQIDLVVPDLGDFNEVAIIDVLVKVGDKVDIETPLVTLETDKATMDVPSTAAGTVTEVLAKKGGKIAKGGVIARIEGVAQTAAPAQAAPAKAAAPPASATASKPAPTPARASESSAAKAATAAPAPKPSRPLKPDVPHDRETQLLVLGAGPGGYTAAFRAADLGLKVTLVERWPMLGGVCLNVGCIPSKALLHAAKVIDEVADMKAHGVAFGAPQIDLPKLLDWKNSVVRKLVGGLSVLAKQRKVEVITGLGRFVSPHVVEVTGADGRSQKIRFEQCIIAAGSEPIKLPFFPDDPRVIDSTGALELGGVPKRLLVVGGGIIGLEMATVYSSLGARLSVVELTGQLMPGADPDLVRPLEKRLKARYEQILLNTKVTACAAKPEGLEVTFEDANGKRTDTFDRVLVAVGRTANGKRIGLENADIDVSDRGVIPVDRQMRTNLPHVFAIGDLVPGPMLAHKAMHEAKVAAEVAAGHKSYFDARVIPSVAYTDPEVAWVGLTETEAKKNGTAFKAGKFPWAASGRSLALGRDEGFTKLLFDPATHRVIGGGMVGPNAGELVAEVALAIEMGADAHDIGLTIHPHPTLSETVGLSAEVFEGTITDLYIPKKAG